jgi:hypothetical protein
VTITNIKCELYTATLWNFNKNNLIHYFLCDADGRNHVPCCIQEGVPDICQDVCRGEYTVITDNIKTHFSCSAYTEETLACIVEGIG